VRVPPALARLHEASLDWRTRLLEGYLRKWVILGVLIGAVAGLGAILFFSAIDWATRLFLGGIADLTPPLPRGEGVPVVSSAGRLWLLPLVTTLGGLISGIIVFSLAPEAEGHGTDAAIEAFHERAGKIRSRIPPIKLLASAITIGSGGSAGREGPTAQIAAGFGSWLGDFFRLSPRDRRIAVATGVGAGIGAIFKAPLGGAILCAEILYIRDFELEALVPGFIASVVGYSIFAAWSGWTPIFGEGLGLRFTQPESLAWYAALGVIAGLAGIAYARMFYGVRDLFRRLRVPPHVKPAIAGLGVGLIGLAFPQVLSMGYGWLQFAIEGNTAELAVGTMLALVALKMIATSLSIGSGGSGGVFAPGLFIGGMVGGAMWGLLHGRVAWMPATPTPFVIVGMMALFGGVAKAPIAVILMVAEMTNEFSMVVPAMMATTLAYLVSGNIRIYENQVRTRADSPAHRGEYAIPLVQAVSVAEAMRTSIITASPLESIAEAEESMKRHGRRGLPVVKDGRLVGMFTTTDALRARQEGKGSVGEAMSTEVVVAYPSDNLHTALQRMTRSGVSRLPVVERERPDELVGILTTRDLAAALDLQVGAFAERSAARGTVSEADPLRSVLVREAMSREFVTVPESSSVRRVAHRLAATTHHAALLVNEEGALTGIVTPRDLEQAANDDPDRPIRAIATRAVVVARPMQSIGEALAQPGAEALRQLPVVEEQGDKRVLVGLLRRSDVLAAYLHARDRRTRIARRAKSLATEHAGDVVTLELAIGPSDPAVGRSLAEVGLPRDSVVTSVLRDGRLIIPRGQVRLQPGDHLQVLASAAAHDAILARLASAAKSADDTGVSAEKDQDEPTSERALPRRPDRQRQSRKD
jgi:CIC family chloride channel protein